MSSQCVIPLLELALAGNLPAMDEALLHRHLESCRECCAALERLAGGNAWCQETRDLLAADELDTASPTRDEWSEVDFTVEHLEPAEEPDVLGRLGGYDVLEVIGHGGMGVVLKAFDRELKRCVAIKVLAPHLSHNSLARKRFVREAQAAAAVVHPNVLAIHHVQAGGRLPFLVMPLVAGASLAQRLSAQGTLELKEILRIGMQAAAGLAAAHEQGLVHRDVKPANILLEKGIERAVLTDFDLARAADDVALTRLGIIAGTPQYMSPEQAQGEPLDCRSDLFSLGCVLYELATGVSPFRADSIMATMRRLVDDAPRALASLNPELPPWFIAIVDRLLEKDPGRRFNSAKQVSELLECCLAHLQQPASVPLPATLPQVAARRGWNRTLTPVGVCIMFAAFVVGLHGVLLVSTAPPDITGEWSGDEWGHVVLKKSGDAAYTGTYSDTFGEGPGELQLKWSRIERRFYGTWREGEDRFGEISLRLVGDQIRGAHTTDAKSKINPAIPRLADLSWTRRAAMPSSEGPPPTAESPAAVSLSEKQADSLRFSETKEVVLSMGSTKFMLDLDTGETMDPPQTLRPEQEQMDVQTDQVQPYHYPTRLIGSSLQGREVNASDWDASVSDVLDALADERVEPLKEMDHGPEQAPTYFFRTRAGTDGILQILGLVDQPKGIRLRYKTLVVDRKEPTTTSATPKYLRHFQTDENIKTIAFSPDGTLVAIANGNPTLPLDRDWKRSVEILNANTGKTIISLHVTTAEEDAVLAATEGLPHFEVEALAFSPDSKVLAVGTGIGQVILLHARHGSFSQSTLTRTGELVRTLDDEKAKLAETKTPERLKSLPRAMGSVASLAFSPDGSLLASCGGSFDDVARRWGDVNRLSRLVTGPGRLKVWEVKTGKLKHDLVGHSHAHAVSFSADGSLLASAGNWSSESANGTGVIIWNPQTGQMVSTIKTDANGGTHSVVFSPTNKLVAIGSRHYDKENDTYTTAVSMTYAPSGITQWQQTIPGWAKPGAFSPDGKSVAVLRGGDAIRFVEIETGKLKHEINSSDSPLGGQWNDFSISPHANRLVIGGIDSEKSGSVTVWELERIGGDAP